MIARDCSRRPSGPVPQRPFFPRRLTNFRGLSHSDRYPLTRVRRNGSTPDPQTSNLPSQALFKTRSREFSHACHLWTLVIVFLFLFSWFYFGSISQLEQYRRQKFDQMRSNRLSENTWYLILLSDEAIRKIAIYLCLKSYLKR